MRNCVVRLIILSLFFCFSQAYATISFEDAVFPELGTSGRALAMGNAFISRVDDSLSAFYNPAGLGSVRYRHFHLSNFHLESNKGWINAGSSGSVTDVGSKFPKLFDLDGTRELMLNHKGNMTHARYQLMPNFTTRYFTLGYLINKTSRTYMGDVDFDYASRFDHGPYAGANISLLGGVFKVGVSAIYLSRTEAVGTASATVPLDVGSKEKTGRGFVLTGGMKLTLPVELLPTFSLVAHNMANNHFSGDNSPTAIKQSYDVGFSLTPQIGKTVRVHFEFDYKDALSGYDGVAESRKLLAGMEFDIARVMFVRFGYGDGFGSAGLGIKTKNLEFDLTTYAVDTTTSAFRGHEDRRFALTLSSGF